MRLGVSDRAGTAPLGRALASQPTLSRVVAALGKGKNAKVLRDGLARFGGWRIRAMNHGGLPKRLVIDLDSLPAEVHGRQPGRGTHYVARVRNNAVLKRLPLPAVDALAWEALLAGRPYEGDEPRTWVCEAAEPYRAGSWSRTRRVVQVLVEEPGELFPRSFWLLTSLSADQATGGELLAMYRQRGKAEGHMGELMSVVNPALSSSPRPKRHYRGRPVEHPGPGIDAFACNEARLLLAVFGYQIMHVQRSILERATSTGWSLRRLLERVLRAPARLTVSGRRIAIDRERGLAALASPGPPAPPPAGTFGVAFHDRSGTEGERRRGIRVPGPRIRSCYRRIEAENGAIGQAARARPNATAIPWPSRSHPGCRASRRACPPRRRPPQTGHTSGQ